ncbi:aminodeoxychorismate/anthranilate synthase component II [Rhodopirellula sp.]|nr:aminodeoxychorismate/anthranilate synthase component II [Rhodopirellula sp.]MDB4476759.1 aminodeoxychorismate/anthranilate synthase component II [Rhodopirellula sp.]MDC0307292.1 aminodeoxychorismate/anthranilate synthase component II [bacterium]MDC0326136.1 aminodeoxychorismate/anthranilate synthase component II [bacterium]
MILLLDNYDSFVHNLARYLRRLGAQTLVVRSDQIDCRECQRLAPDAVVLSPGPKGPFEAGCSVDVIRNLGAEIPILGVCLGHQAIAVAFGATVSPCPPMHGMASPVTHRSRGLFAGLPSTINVGRYHSLAVDEASLPEELMVTARSQDDDVIMGIQHVTRPVHGVQFHPESVLTEEGMALLENFVVGAMRKNVHHSQHDPKEMRPKVARDSTRGELAS